MHYNTHKALSALLTILLLSSSYTLAQPNQLAVFTDYFNAESSERWAFTTDTVRLWFEERSGEPILKIKGQPSTSKWKEWDEEMNTIIKLDSIWYNEVSNSVQGFFYENNDFYQLIGKPPTKTLRTYWFQENKIKEILIYWIPEENTLSDVFLEPIAEWAEMHAKEDIMKIYPNNRIVPSKENAINWRKLINRYNSDKKD